MQERRFWPPTKHKLLYANLIVYGLVIVLLAVFHHELIWAQKTLRGYLFSGNIPPSKDRLLMAEAIKKLKKDESISHVQSILERALQIDPYSNARLLLGDCYLWQGHNEKMLACYDRYRSINPSVIDIYTKMIEILEKKQDHNAIEQLLAEGIEHFRRRVELYQPLYDPTVPKEFNIKALNVYNTSKEGLERLKKVQEKQ